MIGMLRGSVFLRDADGIVFDVNGVGYQVSCTSRTADALAGEDDATLVIETHVREDRIQLFGFTSAEERALFRSLHGVNGVGGKIALSLLDRLGGSGISIAIRDGDVQALCRADGVGKKLAQRIITELDGKLPDIDPADAPTPCREKATAGLVSLGFKRREAEAAIEAVPRSEGETVDALIWRALHQRGAQGVGGGAGAI